MASPPTSASGTTSVTAPAQTAASVSAPVVAAPRTVPPPVEAAIVPEERRDANDLARTTFKDWVDIVQSLVTIAAVIVGGLWTYEVFIKERHDYPHANIEHKTTHLSLSDKKRLLRVGLDLTNAGSALMKINHSIIRIQQILPAASCSNGPCAASQLKDASAEVERKDDRFAWPLIAERDVKTTIEIEPGEKQSLDYEFVIPPTIKAVRIYTYFRNEQRSKKDKEIGWYASSYYDFSAAHDGGKK